MKKTVLFSERQRWPWFVYLPVAIIFVVYGVGMYSQIVLGKPIGNPPEGNLGLILTTLLVLALTAFLFMMRLETRISAEGVDVRMFPFHIKFRKYSWEEISEVNVRDYQPLFEYGGWGIRGFRNNRALSMSGKTGLQLVLNNGRKLLIGTCKKDEVNKVLVELKK